MVIGYQKFLSLLDMSELKKGDLQKVIKMSSNTMAKLGKNETVSMDRMLPICEVLAVTSVMLWKLFPTRKVEFSFFIMTFFPCLDLGER